VVADFRNHTVAIGDQNRLAAGRKPNIFTQLIGCFQDRGRGEADTVAEPKAFGRPMAPDCASRLLKKGARRELLTVIH
jgi:hypothetical protein